MASETPKKVVDEISKCSLCSSPLVAQEREFIFGNSTHNSVEIIRSSISAAMRTASCSYAKLCVTS